MTDGPRRRQLPGWLWPLLLLGTLALSMLLEPAVPGGLLEVANPDASAAERVSDAFDGLPDDPLVLVAMDPDLGTYPEIRDTVRAALDQLRTRGALLALVSYTMEGRAVAAAEVERLRAAGASADRVADLGFVAGAEAGLVLSVTDLGAREGGDLASGFSLLGGGIAATDMVLVVGGVDIGPRTWVEQVATRVPELPLVAIVPTFMQPEVAPYLRSGQLQGLIATVRDAAAFSGPGAGAPPLGLLAGMLVALAFVVRALAAFRQGGDAGSDLPEEPA
ncbi:MAG TPA: hypothetical protein VF071_08660 [Candidatus Limnocylindria bacterium]